MTACHIPLISGAGWGRVYQDILTSTARNNIDSHDHLPKLQKLVNCLVLFTPMDDWRACAVTASILGRQSNWLCYCFVACASTIDGSGALSGSIFPSLPFAISLSWFLFYSPFLSIRCILQVTLLRRYPSPCFFFLGMEWRMEWSPPGGACIAVGNDVTILESKD